LAGSGYRTRGGFTLSANWLQQIALKSKRRRTTSLLLLVSPTSSRLAA
jgi:hypothetical protein